MKRKLNKDCELCGKNQAKGFAFRQPKDFDEKVQEFMALEKEHLEPLPLLTGNELMEACNPNSPLRAEIMKRDKFTKRYFPKDEVLLTCHYCADESGICYYVTFLDFGASPSEVIDWIAHLDGKQWMSWENFVSACKRMRNY